MPDSTSISEEIIARRSSSSAADAVNDTAYLVLDTESVPDGDLIARVSFPAENLSAEEAIRRAQAEALEKSGGVSDFIPVTFQIPVAVCVLRVGADFTLRKITCLDAPLYRPAEITRQFWKGVADHQAKHHAKLVTFNGRAFDLPLMELAAYRWSCDASRYFRAGRDRFQGNQLDLMEWFSNRGACRMNGGLNLLAKMLGMPGKMAVAGDQVREMHRAGKFEEINDYCMFDTLDTYFVFLRSRVVNGELTANRERELVMEGRDWLVEKTAERPALQRYLDAWQPVCQE
ncbi:MAG: ribonuclease H-like domain-containing protein [Candidatus Acidiferrum sp.]